MDTIFDQFTKEEQLTILEIARFALSDADIYEYVMGKMDMSDLEAKTLQEKIELATNGMGDEVKDSYPEGVCPDCQTEIPIGAPEGWSCPNCGHACYSRYQVTKNDDKTR